MHCMGLALLLGKASTRAVVTLAIICSIVMVVDSIFVNITLSIGQDLGVHVNSVLFISFVAFFIISNYSFLKYTRIDYSSIGSNSLSRIDFSRLIVSVCQIVISFLLVLIAIQILVNVNYHLLIVTLIIYISHISAISFITFLAYQFVAWFSVTKNYLILFYAFGFSIITITLILSAFYLETQISKADPVVTQTSIERAVNEYSSLGSGLTALGTAHAYASIASFVTIWIPTAFLLKTHYTRRLLYWSVVLIALVFFLLPYISSKIGIFDIMFLEYGKQFSLIYYIIFSPYQQFGGLLFGIAFWLTARKIRRKNLKALVNTTGIGISLLFGSVVINGLTYVVLPPFGLVTVPFMALASYMLFIGLNRSSKELTRDANIRREIYKIAGQEYSLLRNIGIAELNRTIKARVDPILEKIAIKEGSQVQEKMDESDYKKFIAEALQELEDRKRIRDTS
jgi:hypothetical protein